MGSEEIVASTRAVGQRLDRFVCEHEPALGRAAVRRMIEAGEVVVNGRRAAAGQRLHAGDRIGLPRRGATPAAVPDHGAKLVIAYEDAFLVAADKPAGMPAHPLRPGERGTLASALVARYPEMAQIGYSPREPGIVHRLDTETSGLMLAARDAETFTALRAALRSGALDKRYLALCAGQGPALGVHEAFLAARGARVQMRAEAFGDAQRVRTQVLSVRAQGGHALVELRVDHARRHQIRAHLALLGFPLVGDARYGGPELAGLSRRHFLHASALHFTHPRTQQPISIYAPLPEELAAALSRVTD
jgi:23S rRNA pseudouridine1911/1915/1917 synthase